METKFINRSYSKTELAELYKTSWRTLKKWLINKDQKMKSLIDNRRKTLTPKDVKQITKILGKP